MFKGGNPIDEGSIHNVFEQYFDEKVKNIVETTKIDDGIYNGKPIINSNNKMFMDCSKLGVLG